jgi:hypothetical protein
MSICANCRGAGSDSSLCGKWVVVAPKEFAARDLPEAERPQWFLVLKADGSFSEHFENHIMSTIIGDTTGTYKRVAESLVLDGTEKLFMDDGYKKETTTDRVHRKLRIVGETLREDYGREVKLVFAREGAKVVVDEPHPKTPQVVRDPKAIKLLEEVTRTYGALTSYADEGTLTSSGDGFMAKDARFHTRFQRPRRFLFVEESLADGRPFETNAVWSDGRKAWLYMSSVGGADERPIGGGCSTISPSAGYECILVPELLVPAEFQGGSPPGSYSGVEFGKDEMQNGVKCRVLKLTKPTGLHLTLWVDPKTMLILKARDPGSDATIVYRPRVGARIPADDFRFKVPSNQ